METLEQIMAKRREAHEAKMQEIQLKEAELKKQKNRLKAEYRAGNRALNEALNKPTAHSIASHRLRDAHNIKRMIGAQLCQWKSQYLCADIAKIGFTMHDDRIEFAFTVPFKDDKPELIGDDPTEETLNQTF